MTYMIPKIIHYCWFGRGKKPELAERCIESWKKYCPDYEIIEWNEDNFAVEKNQYCREAYENKKFAFVTDVVRLYAMYTYGGIYMDTDVEVVKTLDDLLSHQAFSGFESPDCVPTGIMACEKGFELFGELLRYYDDKAFINNDGTLNMQTNVIIITNTCTKYGLRKNGEFQILNGFALYPRDYFCPYDNNTGKLTKTKNTYTIHWFNKSWLDRRTRIRSKITRPLHRILGTKCFKWLRGKER